MKTKFKSVAIYFQLSNLVFVVCCPVMKNVQELLRNFEAPDNDLSSACHVYPISHRAWLISVLFIVNRFTWGLN